MKNLFLVSVAIGIFSGTTLTVKAQPSVNMEQVNTTHVQKKSPKFINSIEIKTAAIATEKPVNAFNVVKTVDTFNNQEVVSIESFTSLQFKYSQLLNMDVEGVTNLMLFAEIEKWWGTRYRYGGATLQGIDCSAYAATVVHHVYGVVLPRTSHDQYEACTKLEQDELQQGDLVFFKTGRRVTHVGFYLINGYFTHASTSIGVTISNLSEPYWNKKFVSGGRINTQITTPAVVE